MYMMVSCKLYLVFVCNLSWVVFITLHMHIDMPHYAESIGS